MKWEELYDEECSLARALSVVGDRWTLLVLGDCFLGARRFETIRQRLEISRSILTDRLNLLEREGVLKKQAYQEKPTRFEYRLTSKGRDLYPVIMTLLSWGNKHYTTEAGPPILHSHTTCGNDFTAILACSECGEELAPQETHARKRPADPSFPRVRRGPIRESAIPSRLPQEL